MCVFWCQQESEMTLLSILIIVLVVLLILYIARRL